MVEPLTKCIAGLDRVLLRHDAPVQPVLLEEPTYIVLSARSGRGHPISDAIASAVGEMLGRDRCHDPSQIAWSDCRQDCGGECSRCGLPPVRSDGVPDGSTCWKTSFRWHLSLHKNGRPPVMLRLVESGSYSVRQQQEGEIALDMGVDVVELPVVRDASLQVRQLLFCSLFWTFVVTCLVLACYLVLSRESLHPLVCAKYTFITWLFASLVGCFVFGVLSSSAVAIGFLCFGAASMAVSILTGSNAIGSSVFAALMLYCLFARGCLSRAAALADKDGLCDDLDELGFGPRDCDAGSLEDLCFIFFNTRSRCCGLPLVSNAGTLCDACAERVLLAAGWILFICPFACASCVASCCCHRHAVQPMRSNGSVSSFEEPLIPARDSRGEVAVAKLDVAASAESLGEVNLSNGFIATTPLGGEDERDVLPPDAQLHLADLTAPEPAVSPRNGESDLVVPPPSPMTQPKSATITGGDRPICGVCRGSGRRGLLGRSGFGLASRKCRGCKGKGRRQDLVDGAAIVQEPEAPFRTSTPRGNRNASTRSSLADVACERLP